jgi:ABC-type sugar transport system ATPase subunit
MDADRLITLMVGRKLPEAGLQTSAPRGEVALTVRHLTRHGHFQDVSFELRRGEILGIAGLMGSGRTELAEALFGLSPAGSGEIQIHGRSARIQNPRDALAHRIAMVSEDRRKYGLIASMSVMHNLTLSSLRECCRMFWIKRQKENRIANGQIRALAIRTPDRDQKVAYLSGGNQQKVVMARTLLTEPDILILDEPTRGIDVGAKAEIYGIIADLARTGKSMIMISSELPEILWLSTRILVMREGRITAELDPRRTTQEEILKHAMPSRGVEAARCV